MAVLAASRSGHGVQHQHHCTLSTDWGSIHQLSCGNCRRPCIVPAATADDDAAPAQPDIDQLAALLTKAASEMRASIDEQDLLPTESTTDADVIDSVTDTPPNSVTDKGSDTGSQGLSSKLSDSLMSLDSLLDLQAGAGAAGPALPGTTVRPWASIASTIPPMCSALAVTAPLHLTELVHNTPCLRHSWAPRPYNTQESCLPCALDKWIYSRASTFSSAHVLQARDVSALHGKVPQVLSLCAV
jgi:hypothetical protein